MKEPVKKKKLKEVIIPSLNILGRKVVDVIEEITRMNARNYTDLTFDIRNYRVSVYTIREETDEELAERVKQYNNYLINKQKKKEKKIEKEMKRKMNEVERLQHEIKRMRGEEIQQVSVGSVEEKIKKIKAEKKLEKQRIKDEKKRIEEEKKSERLAMHSNKNRFDKI